MCLLVMAKVKADKQIDKKRDRKKQNAPNHSILGHINCLPINAWF